MSRRKYPVTGTVTPRKRLVRREAQNFAVEFQLRLVRIDDRTRLSETVTFPLKGEVLVFDSFSNTDISERLRLGWRHDLVIEALKNDQG